MDYPTISFAKTRTQWFYLPGDATSHLGSSAGWNFSKQTPSKTSPPHGYYKCANTPGLWKHITRPILFTLVINDFGVKYVGQEYVEHLIACIKEK
jgi:hypothetical protein